MKKDNKKALYESIMTSVAKKVKKTLNELYDGDGLIFVPDSDDYVEVWDEDECELDNSMNDKGLLCNIIDICKSTWSDKFINMVFNKFPNAQFIIHFEIRNNEENEPYKIVDRDDPNLEWEYY